MKKLKIILLVILILMSGLPIDPQKQVRAASRETGEKAYEVGAWFEDGSLVFVAPNKKASSNTTYGTKSFIIRADTTCSSTIPESAECTPLKGGDPDKDYLRIDLYNSSGIRNDIWKVEDIGECTYIKQYVSEYRSRSIAQIESATGCKEPGRASASEAVVVARFVTDKAKFAKELVKHDTFQNLANGQTVYLNTVFLIKYNGVPRFTPEYATLGGIRSAQIWANDSFFRGYYDVPVTFYGSYPLKVQSLIDTNRTIKLKPDRDIVSVYGPPNDEEYETGLWPSWKYDKDRTKDGNGVTLDKTITHTDGKVYNLKCSYITKMEEPEEKNCTDTGNEPYWVRGSDLTERNPAVYVGGTYVVALYELVDCKCSTEATIPNKTELEGEVPADNTVIGKKVTMQVNLQQAPDSYEDWEKWVGDKSDFNIRIKVYRSDQTDVLSGLSNTGAAPIWKKASALEPAIGVSGTVQNSVSKEELLAYLAGGAKSKVLFEDDLANYPIPEGGKVSFRYNADVSISAKDKDGKVVTINCGRPEQSTVMTWFRPQKPKVNVGNFTSVPKYFSEIKEGSPQMAGTSSNETFDAMSGTPTTRSLYFASGGSEFIVDVQVEYVPKVTQTRSYKSEFKSVVNGWAMSPIIGSFQQDSQPPRPTPRQKTDQCGAPYTETVTPKNQRYIKGYTTGENPQPIYGTEYGWDQLGYPATQVGGYVDTWTQTVTFDYMKINKAVVWKIDRSKVDGMTTLVGANEVTATITQGDPTIFYNIASSNTSAAGRLRYDVETNMHDAVYWDEKSSDNCLSNSKDSGPVKEQEIFTARRNTTGSVTAISDFLILQTSSGDQSVMYFDNKSNEAKVTDQLDVPITDFDTMWTNNTLSAAKWDVRETIKIGSYTGNYGTPSTKYSGASTGIVSTIFDTKPAELNRNAHPAPYMRLVQTGLRIPVTLRNGEYRTGSSSVFYRVLLNSNSKSLPVAYSTSNDIRYDAAGQAFASSYSPIHSKVNDVVVHNPVSVENAMVISLPNSLDQRTPTSKAIGGNRQEGVAEYERMLDPNYRQNIIPNADAEIVNVNKSVAGWGTAILSGTPVFSSRTGVLNGTSFEIGGSGTGSYTMTIPLKPNVQYRFDGAISGAAGTFKLEVLNSSGSIVQTNTHASTMTFTTPSTAVSVKIHITKTAANGSMHADNLRLRNMSVQEFVAVAPVFVTQEVPNLDYVPATNGTNTTFNYTGSVQTFTAPDDGVYTIEAWGASGGTSSQKSHYGGSGGQGGYSKGEVILSKGQVIHVYAGGQGGSTGVGGWNGGGSASCCSAGGGGATDVRIGGNSLSNRVIVAGGGGGGGAGTIGGAGGGTSGGSGGSTSETSGGSGGTQYSGYSLGSGGSASGDSGAGGGGYYGGYAAGSHACSNPDSAGGGGSGYIGGVSNGIMTNGGNTGNGKAVIKSPPREAIGLPTKTISTVAGGADTSPPSSAYILVPTRQNPMTPAGGYAPGNFLLLDYGFQLYFPNTGDFYGNGQWGWTETTGIRGKGFINGMDTTEWTRAKYVKFDFHVIYNNVLYKEGAWIPLTVSQTLFDFYVPLANREKISALVEFKSIANNAPFEDNDIPTNKTRYGYAAHHSTLKRFNIDVVGRIGNMVIEDTGDFRFSNLFKNPLVPTEWLVPNVVKKVNQNSQNKIVGDTVDIRGQSVNASTRYLNTYGLLAHMQQVPIPLPLSSENNNIEPLKIQPLRLGYDVLSDIQTIGNYYSDLQIIPYFYSLNLQNGAISQVDIYINVNGEYKPVNKFGAARPGWDPSSVHANQVWLDWESQFGRRNVTEAERSLTSQIAGLFAESGGNTAEGKAAEPFGSYLYGTSQIMHLTGRNRTYIGQDSTYGANKNPGNKLSMLEYGMQAQRWHYSYLLPSSAVAVLKDQQPTQSNINALRTNTNVIVMAADILAVGDTYTLQYKAPNENGTLNLAGTSWPLRSIPYPVVAVYSSSKSSSDDLTVLGSH